MKTRKLKNFNLTEVSICKLPGKKSVLFMNYYPKNVTISKIPLCTPAVTAHLILNESGYTVNFWVNHYNYTSEEIHDKFLHSIHDVCDNFKNIDLRDYTEYILTFFN